MTIRQILLYALLPLVVIALLVFAIFHKPLIRYFTFDKTFNQLIEHRGQEVAIEYAHQILAMGARAEEPLMEKYQNSFSVVDKYYALYLLGRLHSEKGAPLILGGLRSKESGVRAGAIRGLKYMMKCDYVPPVTALLADPVRDIRFEAVAALGMANCPESVAVLRQLVVRERDQNIWARAWLSLRYLLPADGEVVEKFRINKELKLVPADDPNAEVGYTYFFLRLREARGETVVYVPRSLWREAKPGDRLVKKAETESMELIPAPGVPR